MREYQHKHVIRTLFYSKTTIVILFVLMILLIRSIIDLNDKRIGVASLRTESEVKKQELQDRVSTTEAKNNAIHTERGFEEYVRATYPVVKDGEGVIVVYDAKSSPVAPVRKDMNVWEDILVWLKGVTGK